MWKTNDEEIWPDKIGFAPEIYVSWLYCGDIKIRNTFVYEYTPVTQYLHLDSQMFWTKAPQCVIFIPLSPVTILSLHVINPPTSPIPTP